MSARVEVRPCRIGMGLFAARAFAPGDTILVVRGRVLDWRVIRRRRGPSQDNCYRFGPETYLDPGKHVSRYVNHSCAPNAGVRKAHHRLVLFAATAIAAGQEITFDYSTLIGDDDIWTMRCRCGARRCRKVIRSFGALPARVRRRYRRRGVVPAFILDTLDPTRDAR
jgi:SET domain-containing protein